MRALNSRVHQPSPNTPLQEERIIGNHLYQVVWSARHQSWDVQIEEPSPFHPNEYKYVTIAGCYTPSFAWSYANSYEHNTL